MATEDVFWPATRNDIHWGVWSGTALIALVILSRTSAGVLSEIAPGWVLPVAVGVLGCNLLTWWWSLPQPAAGSARAQIVRGGIGVCPSLIIGVVLAGASSAVLIGVLGVVACGLAFVIVQAQQLTNASKEPVLLSSGEGVIDLTPSESAPPAGALDDPLVQQQIVRRRTASGGDSLEALLRVEFSANQREASVHLPIQPAFSGLPEVECEPLEEADVDLKVAAVHPYGVRIDAKRAGQELESAVIAVGILVHSAFASEAAA